MLKSILTSFARSYGRALGRTAARRTSWLAVPLLIVVVVLGILEVAGGGLSASALGPLAPTFLQIIGR